MCDQQTIEGATSRQRSGLNMTRNEICKNHDINSPRMFDGHDKESRVGEVEEPVNDAKEDGGIR